jgi:hypothetical protein
MPDVKDKMLELDEMRVSHIRIRDWVLVRKRRRYIWWVVVDGVVVVLGGFGIGD